MDPHDDRLDDISEIRQLMERSSKFLSLSGLSGVSAGTIGLLTAGVAQLQLSSHGVDLSPQPGSGAVPGSLLRSLVVLGFLSLSSALGLAVLFSMRMAKKKGMPIWTSTARSLLGSIFIPLFGGGAFCLILIGDRLMFLVPSATLIFYGLALLNASTFTLQEIRYLGICEICAGLLAAAWPGAGLALWGLGFGLLHIVYGTLMYFRHEK